MFTRKVAYAALAAVAVFSAGAAHARGAVDVQWQVVIGGPLGGLPVLGGVVLSSPTYRAEPVYLPRPVVVVPRHAPVYRQPSRWDRDGDGIPNRYDRVYNPRWDRDGDGIPNRYDRHVQRGHRDWRDERRGRDDQDRRGGNDRGHRGGR